MPMNARPRTAAEKPAETGALVIRFRDACQGDAACRLVETALGRLPIRSADYAKRLPEFANELRNRGVAYYDEFGLAIVDPAALGADPALAQALSDNEDVLSVRPEYRLEAIGLLSRLFGRKKDFIVNPQPSTTNLRPEDADVGGLTWGLSVVKVGETPFTGRGVKVAILDTGVDFEHPDFVGRNIVSESFAFGETAQDGIGHGTHVAGTAVGPAAPRGAPRYGVAPDAALYVAKVLANDGSGREGDVLAGVLWALENGCDIISMSLGRRALPGDADGDFDRVGQIALDQGALMIAAAGNESARSIGIIAGVGAPAAARSVMAVAAIDDALGVADFSNGGLDPDGGLVDIAGPGVDVLSATPGSEPYLAFSGTSMAAPHVSGVAALLAESNPALRGRALWSALVNGAKALDAPARDVGAGLVQAPIETEDGVA